MSARAAWTCCTASAALGLVAELARPAPSDIGFFLYAAGQALHGAQLYRQVVDLNPPLIFVMNMPVVLLARMVGLSEFLVYRLGTALLLSLLLLYSGRLLIRYVLPDAPARARYVLVLLSFVLFVLVRFDFGQREHFVLALLVPYMLLTAAGCAGRKVPAGEGVAIGVAAGVAVGLKPHFALAWVVLEAVRRIQASPGHRWRVTPEVAGLLGFLVVYGAGVLWLTPDYLTVVSLLGPAYLRYGRESFAKLLIVGPGVPLVAFVLLALLVLRGRVRTPRLDALLAWTMVACFAAGAAQQKDFRYHFYPALGLAFTLLGLIAADSGNSSGPLSVRIYGRASRALLATILLVVVGSTILDAAGGDAGQRRQRVALAELVRAVRTRAEGRPVGILSYTTESAFPLVNLAHVNLASRFPGFWLLPATYWDAIVTGGPLRYHAVEEMAPAEHYFLNAVREDLIAAQPDLLLILRPARDAPMNRQRRVQYIRYFDRDPKLAALLGQYRFAGREGEYLLYERAEAGSASSGPPPSAAPGTLDVSRMQLADLRLSSLDPEFLTGLALLLVCWVSIAGLDRRRAAK